MIPLGNGVYFEFPVCSPESAMEREGHYVSFLCLDRLIIALDSNPVTENDDIVKALSTHFNPVKLSAATLLSALLAQEFLRSAQMVEELRAAVFRLDELMVSDQGGVQVEHIQDLKRPLRAHDTDVHEQLACFDQLSVLDEPFLNFPGTPRFSIWPA